MIPLDKNSVGLNHLEAINQNLERVHNTVGSWDHHKEAELLHKEMPILDVMKRVLWLKECGKEIDDNSALYSVLVRLYHEIDWFYDKSEESQEKNSVLELIRDTFNNHFAALLLKSIEEDLPKGVFAPFKRDSLGNYIDPKSQLRQFERVIGVTPKDRPEGRGVYIRNAKLTINREVQRLMEPFPLDVREGNKWKEITDFYNAKVDGLNVFKRVIPVEVSNLTGLKKLTFSSHSMLEEANSIYFLPDFLENLRSLEELYLGNTHLSSTPEVIYRLPALRILDTNFVPDLHRLPSLSALYLHKKPVKEIDFSHSKALEVLSLSNCELTELPPTISGLTQLKHLSVNKNSLEVIPEIEFLSKLERLYIVDNPHLVELPIGSLHNLTELRCDEDHLRLITFSPNDLAHLKLEKIWYCTAKTMSLWEKTLDGPSLTEFLDQHKQRGEKLL